MKYTVGALSGLAGVSTRTLRYYDRIGLLKPEAKKQLGISRVRGSAGGPAAADPVLPGAGRGAAYDPKDTGMRRRIEQDGSAERASEARSASAATGWTR